MPTDFDINEFLRSLDGDAQEDEQAVDFNEMSFDWRQENQDKVAAQIGREVQERRTGVRMFYCRNLFKAFGYGNRSADSAIRIEQVLAEHGMQVEPSIQRGPDGFELSTTDWVRVSLRPANASTEAKRLSTTFPDGVVTAGSGPYPEEDFDRILREQGIAVHGLGSSGKAILILGRHDWSKDDLDSHIESRRGTELRVYSQEMFLAYLATRKDPYDNPDLLEGFGEAHPALEFLSEWGFDWPHTTIVPGLGLPGADDGDPADWPQVGLLKHLGYSVGANGISRWERQRILRAVFTDSVPNVQSMAYMAEWGTPNSSTRLQKLANSIASFARYAQRRASPPEEAIRDWEEDLGWLEETFYRGKFRFRWPSTYVR